MASEQHVRQYLAYWFQLGKSLINQRNQKLLPAPVIQGNRYSFEFEAIWQHIISENAQDYYLEGTVQTIAELLTPLWEINPCARCSMPVPSPCPGLPPSLDCPCSDLPNWPNTEMPQPRAPIDTNLQLMQIRDRLLQSASQPQE